MFDPSPNTLDFRMRYGANCFKRRSSADMRHGDNISLPDSVMEISRPVNLSDFAEHYRIMSADSGKMNNSNFDIMSVTYAKILFHSNYEFDRHEFFN